MTSSRTDALADAACTHHAKLHALAYRMLGDHDAADDAVQDAYVRALQAIDAFRGDAAITTWLYRIVSNVCLDALRRRRHVTVDPGDDGATGVAMAMADGDFAPSVAARADLDAALVALPDALRHTLFLTDVWGFDYEETGALLGIPKGTVGSRVHRAKQSMRAALAA